MTLTLIVMRHAKSGWTTPLPDHERPLNDRGKRAATNLGHWLRSEGLNPGEALVSDAARTRQTFDRLRIEAAPRFEPRLYLAEAHIMLEVLATAREKCVLIVGHNPGIAELAEGLAETAPEDGAFLRYPTGATTVMRFAAPGWASLTPGTGEVTGFTVPRRLEGDAAAG